MANIDVFIDESGNAGANLLDAHPFFTLVGVATESDIIPTIEKEIDEIKLKSGILLEEELKGSDAIREDRYTFVKSMVEVVLSTGEPIFWSVIERRFMIAAIIVDNLYDYVYNDSVGPEWTLPSNKRQDLANHFYNYLSDEALELAAKSLVYGDANGTRQLIQTITEQLAEHRVIDDFDAVAALSGAMPHIDKLCSTIMSVMKRDHRDPLRSHKGTIRSPNIASFFEIIGRIEDYYRGRPNSNVELIFDSSVQFDSAFAHLHKLLSTAHKGELRFAGRPPILFGYECVRSFKVADSKSCSLLQSADLFAAGIRVIFDLIAKDNPPVSINDSLTLLWGFVATNLNTSLYNYVISDAMIKRILPTIERFAPRR